MDNSPTPEALSAALTMQAIEAARITHVVTVPDTYQRTLLAAIDNHDTLKLIQCWHGGRSDLCERGAIHDGLAATAFDSK